MKLLNFLQTRGLTLIMILFFIISITGIFNDYSLNAGGDETILMAATIKMISEHTLRPNFPTFYHVPLGTYFYLLPFIMFFIFLRLSGVFTDINSLKEFGLVDYQKFLPFARFLSVLMAAVSIYLLYKITQKLFNNKWVSLLAAYFLSVSLMFVQVAHLARVWLPQVMTILIAFYFIVILYQRPENKFKDYLLAGLSLGLALGTHVVGIMVYASFFVAHYLKNSAKKIKDIFIINKYFWLVNIIIIISYFLILYLNPYGFKNNINKSGGIEPSFTRLFYQNFNRHFGISPNVGILEDTLDKLAFYPWALFEHEPLLVLLAVLGFIILFFKEKKKFYLIVSFVAVYYFAISFVGWEPRYILPAVPFFAIAASFGVFTLYNKMNKVAVICVLVPIMIIMFAMPLAWDYRMIQPSNRLSAIGWIYKNIPAGSRIINFDPLLELNENKQTLVDISQYADSYYTKKRAYLLSRPENEYACPNYYILYPSYFTEASKELLNKKYDYLIFFWNNNKELNRYLDKAKIFTSDMVLLKRFPEYAKDNSDALEMNGDMKTPIYSIFKRIRGPIIDIYKLKAN